MMATSPHSIEKALVIRAKSRVARWFDMAEQPVSLRPKLLKGVESIAQELMRRCDWYEVMTVRLDDSEDIGTTSKRIDIALSPAMHAWR